MADSGQYWGGGNTTKSYEIMLAGATPVQKPTSLVGHALTNPNAETIDAVTVPYVKKERGKIRTFQKTLRSAQQTGLTFTMTYGSLGEVYTPLLSKARRRGGQDCPIDLFVVRLCPRNSETAHFYALPEASLSEPVFSDSWVVNDDTEDPVTFTSELRVEQIPVLWQLGIFRLVDLTEPIYAVAFQTEGCTDCADDDLYQNIIAVGGVGGVEDSLIIYKTADRFASNEVIANPAPDASIGTSIYTDGDIVLIGFADTAVVTTGTVGGTLFSADALASAPTIDGNITEPVRGVGFFQGEYIAVGGTAAGAPKLWTSVDGVTWTASASGALGGTTALTSIAVDEENEVFYTAGEGGLFLKGNKNSGTIALAAITLPGSPGVLNVVRVLGPDHVAVGGASNYYAESFDGGVTWVQPSIPGTGTVAAIAGSKLRAVFGAGTLAGDRTVLTDAQFKSKTTEDGLTMTGDFTSAHNLAGEENYFVLSTDDGEIALMRPYMPGA